MKGPEGFEFDSAPQALEITPEDLENERIVENNVDWFTHEMPTNMKADIEAGNVEEIDEEGKISEIGIARCFGNVNTGELIDQEILKRLSAEEQELYSPLSFKVKVSGPKQLPSEENEIAWGSNFTEKAKQIIEASLEEYKQRKN